MVWSRKSLRKSIGIKDGRGDAATVPANEVPVKPVEPVTTSADPAAEGGVTKQPLVQKGAADDGGEEATTEVVPSKEAVVEVVPSKEAVVEVVPSKDGREVEAVPSSDSKDAEEKDDGEEQREGVEEEATKECDGDAEEQAHEDKEVPTFKNIKSVVLKKVKKGASGSISGSLASSKKKLTKAKESDVVSLGSKGKPKSTKSSASSQSSKLKAAAKGEKAAAEEGVGSGECDDGGIVDIEGVKSSSTLSSASAIHLTVDGGGEDLPNCLSELSKVEGDITVEKRGGGAADNSLSTVGSFETNCDAVCREMFIVYKGVNAQDPSLEIAFEVDEEAESARLAAIEEKRAIAREKKRLRIEAEKREAEIVRRVEEARIALKREIEDAVEAEIAEKVQEAVRAELTKRIEETERARKAEKKAKEAERRAVEEEKKLREAEERAQEADAARAVEKEKEAERLRVAEKKAKEAEERARKALDEQRAAEKAKEQADMVLAATEAAEKAREREATSPRKSLKLKLGYKKTSKKVVKEKVEVSLEGDRSKSEKPAAEEEKNGVTKEEGEATKKGEAVSAALIDNLSTLEDDRTMPEDEDINDVVVAEEERVPPSKSNAHVDDDDDFDHLSLACSQGGKSTERIELMARTGKEFQKNKKQMKRLSLKRVLSKRGKKQQRRVEGRGEEEECTATDADGGNKHRESLSRSIKEGIASPRNSLKKSLKGSVTSVPGIVATKSFVSVRQGIIPALSASKSFVSKHSKMMSSSNSLLLSTKNKLHMPKLLKKKNKSLQLENGTIEIPSSDVADKGRVSDSDDDDDHHGIVSPPVEDDRYFNRLGKALSGPALLDGLVESFKCRLSCNPCGVGGEGEILHGETDLDEREEDYGGGHSSTDDSDNVRAGTGNDDDDVLSPTASAIAERGKSGMKKRFFSFRSPKGRDKSKGGGGKEFFPEDNGEEREKDLERQES